jgi:hypothetical protein
VPKAFEIASFAANCLARYLISLSFLYCEAISNSFDESIFSANEDKDLISSILENYTI